MTDDLRNRLDQLSDRVPEAPSSSDAFDRLDRGRHRRNRSRKIGAIVVALLVAVGGTATAVIAFDDDGRSRVAGDPSPTPTLDAWSPSGVLTLWPENPIRAHVADPTSIQRLVAGGDEQLQWRTDHEQVVRRFAAVVLGWSDVSLDPPIDPEMNGSVVWGVRPDCEDEGTAEPDCQWFGDPLRIVLVQPVTQGEGGIWSVVEVESDDLSIAGIGDVASTRDGQIVANLGSWIEFHLRLPEGVDAHVGYAVTDGCEVATSFDVSLHVDQHDMQLPTRWERTGEGCASVAAGYIFVYAQGGTTVPVGDPFVEAAGFESPWVSIMPIRLDLEPGSTESAGSSSEPEPSVGNEPTPAASATIRCDDETVAVIDGVEVIAQPDGVHVSVENASSRTVAVSFVESGEEFQLDPGTHDVVTASPPGMETVRCAFRDAGFRGSVNLEMIDPDGVWTPIEPECEDGLGFGQASDFASEPAGIPDALEAGARELEPWREPGDEIRFGGYADAAEHRHVVLVRDLRVVAVAELARGTEGWYAPSLEACQNG